MLPKQIWKKRQGRFSVNATMSGIRVKLAMIKCIKDAQILWIAPEAVIR